MQSPHNPALRRPRSIPSRPSHRNAALGHARIARLRRRSLVAALRAASNPFPPSPFQICVRRAAGKDGAGFPSRSHNALPQERRRAWEGVMRCVGVSAIRAGSPLGSMASAFAVSVRSIRPSAFCYPEDRSLYCDAEECGRAASRDFSARVFDEENNTSL